MMFLFSDHYHQADEDKANIKKLIEEIKKSKKGKTIGVFAKENYPGSFIESWKKAVKNAGFEQVFHLCGANLTSQDLTGS